MHRVTVVRYTTKPDHTAENEALSRAVFAQLRSAPPEGVAYALFRDGDQFIHVFLNLKADESAPVTELPAFKAFEKGVAERCEAPPNVTRLATQLVDCYGFGASRAS
jgi:quinol monooxygenase YgiN